jgi:hypothetical protein
MKLCDTLAWQRVVCLHVAGDHAHTAGGFVERLRSGVA